MSMSYGAIHFHQINWVGLTDETKDTIETRGKARFARLPLDRAENFLFYFVVKSIFWDYQSFVLATAVAKMSFEVAYVVKNKFLHTVGAGRTKRK